MRSTVTALLMLVACSQSTAAQDGTIPYEPIISCTDPRTLFMQSLEGRSCNVTITLDQFQIGADGMVMRSQTCLFTCADTSAGGVHVAFPLPYPATNTPPGTVISLSGVRNASARYLSGLLSNRRSDAPVNPLLKWLYGTNRTATGQVRGPGGFARGFSSGGGGVRGDDDSDSDNGAASAGGPFDDGRRHATARADGTVSFVGWSLGGPQAAVWNSVEFDQTNTEDYGFLFGVDGGKGWLEVKLDDETIWAGAAEEYERGETYVAAIPGSVLAGRRGLLLMIVHNDDPSAMSEFVVGDLDTMQFSDDEDGADRTAPAISCATDDGTWKAADVVVTCEATDDGSGLAHAADATVVLTTSVADGVETPAAATNSHQICDVAGNCATAGPISGLHVDRKAPAISVTSPVSGAYIVNEVVRAQYSCNDGGSGVRACAAEVPSGSPLSTTTPGTYTLSVTATDHVANTSAAAINYSMTYGICALYDDAKPLERGRTVPIKLRLCDVNGRNLSTSAVHLTAATMTNVESDAAMPVLDAGRSNPDLGFRYDASFDGYIFNLQTRGLEGGTYRLTVTAEGDPVAHHVGFRVK